MSEVTRRELPSGWRLVRLRDVCEIIAGQSPPGSTYRNTDEGLPFFQGKADFGPLHPVARVWCVEPTKIAQPGDILISVRAPVGPTNIADVECCVGRGLAAIRCGEQTDRSFLLSALRRFEIELARKGSGSTFDAISRADLENLALPLPPLGEQQRITAVLNERMASAERARGAAQAQLNDAKALPAAYLRQVFAQPGQPLPEGWRWVRLGEVCEIRLGKMLSPKSKQGVNSFPYLRNANVQWNRIDTTDVAYMDFDPHEQTRFRLRAGDLLVCEGGEPGRSAVWDARVEPCFYQKALHRLRPIDQAIDPYFIMFRMWAGILRNEFATDNAKTTIAHLPAVRLETLSIPLPPLPEQQSIAAELNDKMAEVETLRAGLQAQLNDINALPAALLRQAFNGEL